jgi:hypothetical protein
MVRRFTTFQELEYFLRNWVSFGYPDCGHQYDLGGMAALFAVCIDNLRADPSDVLDDLGGFFTDDQKAFLATLAQNVNRPGQNSN